MFADWAWASWERTGLVAISAPIMVALLIANIRLIGLRSFSKMSSFDFAVTVAIGSILAAVVTSSTSVLTGFIASFSLLGTQWGVAQLRRRSALETVVDNSPLLLMRNGEVFEDALTASRVTRSDLIAKLREANVLRIADVRAVVFESTGDVSVVHGEQQVDEVLLDGVRRIGTSTDFRASGGSSSQNGVTR